MTLEIQNITKSFGKGEAETQVLKGIDFNVDNGEFVILKGASGSGKTTLLTILGGLLTANDGQILYNNAPLFSAQSKPAELRLTEIGFIFQSAHLVPYLKVKDQLITIGVEAGMTKKEARTKAEMLLNRIAIMRAFMNNPKIILADEPTASLDAARATEVVEMFKKQVKDEQMIAIMITHDNRLFDYADRIIELEDGKIVQQ